MNQDASQLDTAKEATQTPAAPYIPEQHGGIEAVQNIQPMHKPEPDAYAHWQAPAAVEKEPKILGLRRTTFTLATALVLVIIVAAVGGGVGGSMAVQNAKR
jgi:hypothetical protein